MSKTCKTKKKPRRYVIAHKDDKGVIHYLSYIAFVPAMDDDTVIPIVPSYSSTKINRALHFKKKYLAEALARPIKNSIVIEHNESIKLKGE